MAKVAKDSAESVERPTSEKIVQECGIVMPISKTASHEAAHWSDVQELLHRAVRAAGLEPKNVWVGSSIDRITPRILSNLFAVPIAICDISDLNPNVMLELGMRLTSKKPTIVVAEIGSLIPFDIRDFEAVFYPSDLNILGMERFFEELREHLSTKLEAYNKGKYEPFLSDVTIEVLEPQSQPVPFEQLVQGQLDVIMSRLERIDSRSRVADKVTPILGDSSRAKSSGIVVSIDGDATSLEAAKGLISQFGYISRQIDDRNIIIPFKEPSETTARSVEKRLQAAGIVAAARVQL